MTSTLTSFDDGFVDDSAGSLTPKVPELLKHSVPNMADDPMSILNEIEKKCMERDAENDPKCNEHKSMEDETADGLKPSNGIEDNALTLDHTSVQLQMADVGQNNNNSNIQLDSTDPVAEPTDGHGTDKPAEMEVDNPDIHDEDCDDDRNSDIMAIDVSTNMDEVSHVDEGEIVEQITEANGDISESVEKVDAIAKTSEKDAITNSLDEDAIVNTANEGAIVKTAGESAIVNKSDESAIMNTTTEGNDSVVSQDVDTSALDESSTLEESSDPCNTTSGLNGDGETFEDPPIEIQGMPTRSPRHRKKRKKSGRGWSKTTQYKVRRLSNQNLVIRTTNHSGDTTAEGIAEEVGDVESLAIGNDGAVKTKPTPDRKGRGLLYDIGEKVEAKDVAVLPPDVFEKYEEAAKLGWRRELVIRNEIGMNSPNMRKKQGSDVYYFPPAGSKLRSMVQILDWLAMNGSHLTKENFTFMRRPIGVHGEVVRNASAARGRSSLESHKSRESIHKELSVDSAKKSKRLPRPRVKKEEIYYYEDSPLYDTPEVVIERDTDDAYAPIIAAEMSGDLPPVRFDTSSIPKKPQPKEVYVGMNGETFETIQPSNESVIVTPTKKLKFKATARKSTMQKPIRLPRPYTGSENLCTVKCPGMEGIAPMLMCNKCMCLFHHECVNYYDQDNEFCCLRCKDSESARASAPDPSQMLQVSLPVQLSQINQTSTVPLSSIPTVVHTSPHPVAVIPSTALLTQPTTTMIYPTLVNQTKTKYQEIKPVKVKDEPVDEAYERVQASSEALGSLKTVLSRRNSTSPAHSGQHSVQSGPGRPYYPLPTVSSLLKQRPMCKINPRLQMPQNSSFKLVPVCPTGTLPNIPFQPIGLPLQGLVPLTPIHKSKGAPVLVSQPQMTTANSLLMPQDSVLKSKPKTSPSKGDKGARLVIDGTTIGAPESGQLLTLPGAVSKKLTLNKPLVLKIKNRQISVPPSGFFQAADGLKIFLPPNTFPTAEDEENAENAKDTKTITSPSAKKGSEKSVVDLAPCPEVTSVKSGTSSADIVKSRRGQKCCYIQKLYGGYDCMYQIFCFLNIKELLAVSLVCRTWRFIAQHPALWHVASFSGLRVSCWPKAMDFLSKRGAKSISLLGMDSYENLEQTWNGFMMSVEEIPSLRKLSFGLVPPTILDAVCLKMSQLNSVCAECVSNEEEDSIWTRPTRLDIGKFGTLKELQELRLKGVCGLTLPTFSLCGGLGNLGTLEHLNTLCLTSLKNVDSSNFHFISKLTKLTELSLGDCKSWTAETYAVLGGMTSVRKLRLEQGGTIPDIGLGDAISKLNNLHTLELYLFTIADTFREHIMGLAKLRTLLIWPDNSTQPSQVNSNTFSAVKDLNSLHRLKWVILKKQSNSIILDDNENPETVSKEQEWIPFLSEGSTADDERTEYIGLGKLTGNLSDLLPNTRIDVFCLESDKDKDSTQSQL